MDIKEELIREIKILRERYNNKVGRFKWFMICLLNAKEAIRKCGYPYSESLEDDGKLALKRAISEYKSYKFCIKVEAKELKELKTRIRKLDRKIRSISK